MQTKMNRGRRRGAAYILIFLMLLQCVGCNVNRTENPVGGTSAQSTAAPSHKDNDRETQELQTAGSGETEGANGETLSPEDQAVVDQWNQVNTGLTKDSIGAKADILATFDTKATHEYTLNPEDYTVSFELKERESDSWTPFIGSSSSTFTVSDEEVIEYTAAKKTIQFTAKKAGECVITAVNKGRTATALVIVHAPEDNRETANSVAYYMGYIAQELKPLNDAERVEYLYNLADYAAILQADRKVDGNLMNAMAAACLIYPSAYLINNYASLLMGRQQFEEALVWLEQAYQVEPGNPVILTNMGECCYELGNFSQALSYTDRAIASQSDFGLAHLIRCCIYLKQGNQAKAIDSLFRSAKTCWTELTTTLMLDLYEYTKEVLEKEEKMIITKDQLDILMEATGYGTSVTAADSSSVQISFPYPAQVTSAALTAQESYWAAASAARTQTEDLRQYREYAASAWRDDPRHVFIARFHILYYEHLIEQWGDNRSFKEERERLEKNFSEHAESTWAPVNEQLEAWAEELQFHSDMIIAAMGLSLVDGEQAKQLLEEHTLALREKTEKYNIEGIKLKINTLESLRDQWHTVLIHIEEAKMDGYEKHLRPLLEEYYQRMYTILSCIANDTVRQNFEKRVLYTINEEAVISPLSYAGADRETEVNKYDLELEMLRTQLDNYYSDRIEAQNQEVQAKAQEQQLEWTNARRQEWGESYSLGLPPFSPIQVHIGINNGNLTYGYSAFGHSIMYERDNKNGYLTQTITSTAECWPFGLGQLASTVDNLSDAAETLKLLSNPALNVGNVADFATGQVVGGIPVLSTSTKTGSINVYNADGELVDSSRIREKSLEGSWGLLGGSITETTAQGQKHNGILTNSITTTTKVKLSFAGISMEKDVYN